MGKIIEWDNGIKVQEIFCEPGPKDSEVRCRELK